MTAIDELKGTNLIQEKTEKLEDLHVKLWDENKDKVSPDVVTASSILISELSARRTKCLFLISSALSCLAFLAALYSISLSHEDTKSEAAWKNDQLSALNNIAATIKSEVSKIGDKPIKYPEIDTYTQLNEIRSLLKSLDFEPKCDDNVESWIHNQKVFVHMVDVDKPDKDNHFYIEVPDNSVNKLVQKYTCN